MTAFSQSIHRLYLFSKSTDLSKALILGLAITLPIVLGVQLGVFEIGLALALGALLSSPSDVSGSQNHKNYGIILSASIAVLASLTGGYLAFDSWWWLPILGIIFFSISYLSVFGFRASLISFSGLFAMVLSFANISNVLEIYERALLIGVGGIWYLGLTVLWNRINPKAQTDQFLAQTFDLTAQYLRTRGELLSLNQNREDLFKKLLGLQANLNDNHETLRDILISARKESGNSGYERKRLLIFIQLVDILELAMANPVNYEKMDKLMENHQEQIQSFQELIFKIAHRLELISARIQNRRSLLPKQHLKESLEEIKGVITSFQIKNTIYPDEGALIMKNLFDYQEKQVENVIRTEKLLLGKDLGEIKLYKNDEFKKFITPQEYSPKLLLENLSIKSPIFKHSLRLALVVMAGYAIGDLFSLQNSYWILLTIIVIMRPNYGLTKTRSKQRTAGTLIGAGIAIGIVLITQNLVVYGVLAVICLITAFAMVQKNYKTSATFVTLSVVFVYALLEPNVLNVIQFRVIDTLIGAGLATVGNLILWPSWEFLNIRTIILESVKANKEFLKEVIRFYDEKGKVTTTYKVSRKQAFLGIGNLSSAFQRMAQEPKSKQKNLKEIYELVTINHSFLSSLASMGTYIQNHTTTSASKHFKAYTGMIDNNLENSLNLLKDEIPQKVNSTFLQHEAELFFDKKLQSFQLSREGQKFDNDSGSHLQEAQLVYEQLKWLLDLSVKLEKKILETNF